MADLLQMPGMSIFVGILDRLLSFLASLSPSTRCDPNMNRAGPHR